MPAETVRDPVSYEEWRYAAALASAWLLIDDARLYGFLVGGDDIDRDRCDEIIARANELHDITIAAEDIHLVAWQILAETNGATL